MQFKLISLFLLIAALAVVQCNAEAIAQYLRYPNATEVAEGQTALFFCHARDALAVFWKINSFGQNNQGFKDLKADAISDHDDSKNSSIQYSNLTIPANAMTNGARVVCIVVSKGKFENPPRPPPVELKVQGTYDPVRDISLTNISYSVTAQWSPPPYLPSLPPTGYNITVMNTTTNETISQGTVSVTSYTFELNPEHLCSILRIRVVAFSDLLGGYTADHVWSLGGAVEPNSILEQLRYIERDTLELSVRFKVAGFCLDQLLSIMLETTCDNITLVNITDASNIDTRGVVSGPHQLSIQELPEDARCSYQIVLFTVTNRTTPSQSMLYDTFDLASVLFNSSVRDRSICVECCFVDGSSALGCHSVQRNFRSKIVRSFNASRIDGSLTTGLQCFEADPGEYTMIVYDINADSTLSDDPYTSSLVIVSTPPPEPTTSPTMTGVSDIAAIVGGAAGGSVFVITIAIIIMIIIIILVLVKHNNKKNNSNDVNNHSVELDSAHASNPINLETAVNIILEKREVKDLPGSYYVCVVSEDEKQQLIDSGKMQLSHFWSRTSNN